MTTCKQCGSQAINHQHHGRDGSDPDLCDVCYWRKRAKSSERSAIMFSDHLHTYILAMRAALVDAELESPDEGMMWIFNTLLGPGHIPDIDEAKSLGGAQAMFDKEMADHAEFRASNPPPERKS